MKYNVLVVKNRTNQKYDFSMCYEWFKKNLNLEIVQEEIKTDFDLTTIVVGNATWKGVIAGGFEQLRSVIPENKYHCVIVLYGNDLNGIRLSACNGLNAQQNLYPNTEIIQMANTDWRILNHEMFHAFFAKAKRFGAKIDDNMDTYYRDNILDTDNGDTNRTIAMRTLTPYWNIITNFMNTTPTVTIVRDKSTDKQTTGSLVASNAGATFVCKTLELPWLNNQPNISCIPKGTYDVTWTFSPRKMRFTYRVQNVPGRLGILFHSANYFYDLLGCIALGSTLADINKDGQLDVTNSRVTMASFEGFMGKKPFKLIIK